MQLRDDKNLGATLIQMATSDRLNGIWVDSSEQVVEQSLAPRAIVPAPADGPGDLCEGLNDPADGFDDGECSLERIADECFGHISRAEARYHEGDPQCEADYRAAFVLDDRLTATEIVRGLTNEVRDDVGKVLITCMERLATDSRDVVARARLGLTLLLLHQDLEAFKNLQRAFLQSPPWRPFLRLLVNKVKRRRERILPQILHLP